MKRLALASGIVLLGATVLAGTINQQMDSSSGAFVQTIYDTRSGDLELGQYALLEDGKTYVVHTIASSTPYYGPLTDDISLIGLTEVSIKEHREYGVFLDKDGKSYETKIDKEDGDAIRRGEKVHKPGRSIFGVPKANAAIAYVSSKTFAGKNSITSSTTVLTIGASDSAVVYGGFNNTNTLNSMSLSCTSGTVYKANAGVVESGAGNAHLWTIAGATPGSITCTVTSSSTAFFLVQTSHYSGTDTTPIDAQNTSTCTSTTSCSSSVTTISNNAWPVAFSANSAGTPGVGAGTTLRVSDANGIGLADSNAAITPAGSTALIFTRGVAAAFAVNILALKPVADAVAPSDEGIIFFE